MQDLSLATRVSLLRQHGSFSQAYSVVYQPDLDYFGDDRGFLACKMVGSTTLVLADPIAPRAMHGELIRRLLAARREVCFWQVSRPIADILAPLGYLINEMGIERRIEVADYNYEGRQKRNLRNAVNRALNQGYVTRECSVSDVDMDEVLRVSDAWRATRTVRNREVRFLCRPIVIADEVDVRKFFTFDKSGRLAAFGFFDPVYSDGSIVGYLTAFKRYRPREETLLGHAINHHVLETLRRDGIRWLFFGLSPLSEIHDHDFEHSWLVRRSFRLVYKNALFNRFIYPLQGHAGHKRQFRGAPEQTYFAFKTRWALPQLFKVLRACDVI